MTPALRGLHECTHTRLNTCIPHSDSNHRLSGKTSTFSTLTALFIHSQSAGENSDFINEFRLHDTLSPSNYDHITLTVQVGCWLHIHIYFFDKTFQSLPSRSNPLIA